MPLRLGRARALPRQPGAVPRRARLRRSTRPARAHLRRPGVSGGGQGQTQVTHAAALLLWLTGLRCRARRRVRPRRSSSRSTSPTPRAALRGRRGRHARSTGSVSASQAELLEYRALRRARRRPVDVNEGRARARHADGARTELCRARTRPTRYPESAPADNLVDVALGRGARTARRPAIGVATVELRRRDVPLVGRRAGHRPGAREEPRCMERVGHVWRVRPGQGRGVPPTATPPSGPRSTRCCARPASSATRSTRGASSSSRTWRCRRLRRARRALQRRPVAQRWEEELGDVIEYPNADPETGWPERLEEVWSL